MFLTIVLAALIFAAQVVAYRYAMKLLERRATYKRRTSVLYVAPFVQRKPAPHAHNRPGDN